MKILVTTKRVIDPYVNIQVKPDGTGVQTQHQKMTMNPFDAIALEEALRFVEKGVAKEVVVVSLGEESSKETLRQALAMGAHRAIFIPLSGSYTALMIAKYLKDLVKKEAPDLVLMGKQAIDTDSGQTPVMLAALLEWPYALFASSLLKKESLLYVTSEVEGGLETVSFPLPAVVSVDLRLNEPRYATLPNIMKAKTKPLAEISRETLPVSESHQTVLKVSPPNVRARGEILPSVAALYEKIKGVR